MVIDSIDKGNIAEAYFQYAALLRSWKVVKPISNSLAYDFAVLRTKKEKWLRVQVKYVGTKNGRLRLKRNKNKTYIKADFDFLFVFNVSKQAIYFIPMSKCKGRTGLRFKQGKLEKYRIGDICEYA